MRQKAFTLAEVLIVVGIIGIVAQFTIPTLIQDVQTQVAVAQLKKTYSSLYQAFLAMETEYGPISNWGLANTSTGQKDASGNDIYDYSSQNWVAQQLASHMNTVKKCWQDDCSNYDMPVYSLNKMRDFGSVINDSTKNSSFVLADGTIIQMGWTTTQNFFDIAIFFTKKGEIVYLGKDKFYFKVFDNKLIPEGLKTVNDISDSFDGCINTNYNSQGRGCSAWVIYNENMDYLKCPSKLSWDGNHKCP